VRRAIAAAALAVLLAGSSRAAVGDAEAEAPVAPLNLGPEEGKRLLNLPPALPTSAPALTISELRRTKCAYLWARVAPWSYSKGLCEFFVSEHERAGIPAEWYWSLVYGFANFGLRIGQRAPGQCFGPMDVKWPGMARQAGVKRPNDLRDPRVNIHAHVLEMAYYHRQTGETGMALLARVFYPASPRRYHRWVPTDRRFRKLFKDYHRKER